MNLYLGYEIKTMYTGCAGNAHRVGELVVDRIRFRPKERTKSEDSKAFKEAVEKFESMLKNSNYYITELLQISIAYTEIPIRRAEFGKEVDIDTPILGIG